MSSLTLFFEAKSREENATSFNGGTKKEAASAKKKVSLQPRGKITQFENIRSALEKSGLVLNEDFGYVYVTTYTGISTVKDGCTIMAREDTLSFLGPAANPYLAARAAWVLEVEDSLKTVK